jgi:hypothetical protein
MPRNAAFSRYSRSLIIFYRKYQNRYLKPK